MRKIVLFSLCMVLIVLLLPLDALAATEPPASSTPPQSSSSPSPSAIKEAKSFTIIKMDSTGPEVVFVQMRLRDLGYFNYRATGIFKAMSRTGVIGFQQQNKLSSDGDVGENTYNKLFLKNLKRCPLVIGTKVTSGPGDNSKAKTYGLADDWFSVVSIAFKKDMTAKITDFNTGIAFDVKRTGGDNHAEVETLTKADTKNFLKIFDKDSAKTYTWEKRAVLVTVGSVTYAGSLFGWPHGEDTVSDNDMAGQTCLYFSGSYSHVYGLTDAEHAAMVKKASAK